MSFLTDYFQNRKIKAREKNVAKFQKKACNKYGQQDERVRAIYYLRDLGGEDAILALLQRFEIMVSSGRRDEEEKKFIYESLLDMEDEAVAPIKEFIQNGISITWPLKALGELLPDEECLEFVCRVLSDMGPSYIRMPEKKITLINFLADYQHPLVADTLLSFLEDFDPEVVILTVQVLSKMKEERARAPFLELLCDEEEENPRLKKMIAQEFKQLNWKVREYRERVKENLPPGFNVDRVGYIRGQARQEIADPEYDEE